ncbi:MAG TPA: hypothetical protein VK914_11445 [bacterium]|jgi:hypothetical protein|nr:hypothetical protein [bacterium]
MKGILIFVAILVIGGIYALANFGQIADPILAHIVLQEGSVDTVQAAGQKDGFATTYQPFLDQRYWLAHVASLMDDDTYLKVAADSVTRYTGTPLETDPEFAFFLMHQADLLVARNQFDAAGALYEQYSKDFPSGDELSEARSALSGLRINHGFQ